MLRLLLATLRCLASPSQYKGYYSNVRISVSLVINVDICETMKSKQNTSNVSCNAILFCLVTRNTSNEGATNRCQHARLSFHQYNRGPHKLQQRDKHTQFARQHMYTALAEFLIRCCIQSATIYQSMSACIGAVADGTARKQGVIHKRSYEDFCLEIEI